jgi:hypothetical protein
MQCETFQPAWPVIKDHFHFLANACLTIGHHPTIWKKALIVVIPKPGRDDYAASMANWRLVFNVICLPTLSYGCQMWSTSRKRVGLIKKVQAVFNDGVKVISGAFRTAPREPLHKLTRVLPARFYIDKLTHTSALRLYRVLLTSQLITLFSNLVGLFVTRSERFLSLKTHIG